MILALIALFLVGCWGAWFLRARIPLYESSQHARIEVSQVGNAVEATIAGRLTATYVALGRSVQKGETLASVDSAIVEQRLAGARAKLSALGPQIEARKNQIAAELDLRRRRADHLREAAKAARARRDEAQAQSDLAGEEARRTAALFATRSVSEAENQRAQAGATRARAAFEASSAEIDRLERQLEAEESEADVKVAGLRSEMADLSSQEESMTAAVRALAQELDAYTIRAPTDGQIAEIAAKQPGAYVQAGERLATIIPSGDLRAVAEFEPARAIGRVHAGQPARVRLDGFPWMQYGSVPATVSHVGAEIRDGRVRVELTLQPEPTSAIPLQHGLPGSVEVRVDEVSPWALVLRVAGRGITAASSEAPVPEAH
jgi:membrane fusion protein (multidrug efflux system)